MALLGKFLLVAIAVVVVETAQSRLRFYRYQELLAVSFVVAILTALDAAKPIEIAGSGSCLDDASAYEQKRPVHRVISEMIKRDYESGGGCKIRLVAMFFSPFPRWRVLKGLSEEILIIWHAI